MYTNSPNSSESNMHPTPEGTLAFIGSNWGCSDPSFLDNAKQGTMSSGLVSLISFVINMPLAGCHNWGGILVVAYEKNFQIIAFITNFKNNF